MEHALGDLVDGAGHANRIVRRDQDPDLTAGHVDRDVGVHQAKAVGDRGIHNIEEGADITLPRRDVSEPVFHHGQGGSREMVHPGNQEYLRGDRIEIVEGLAPGSRVVVAGGGFLADGDLVRVSPGLAPDTPAPASPATQGG